MTALLKKLLKSDNVVFMPSYFQLASSNFSFSFHFLNYVTLLQLGVCYSVKIKSVRGDILFFSVKEQVFLYQS